MLHKKIIGSAVAVVMLVTPVNLFARTMGGFGHAGMGGFGHGGMHSFGPTHGISGMHSFSGSRSFAMAHGFVGGQSHIAAFPGHRFAAFPGHRFVHFRHFGHRHHFPIFVTGLGVGYYAADSCWQWVPTPHGWNWTWVCNYYDYY